MSASVLNIPVIETARLRLRAPVAADFDTYSETLMSPRAQFSDGPMNLREAWLDFAKESAGWILQGFGLLSIEDAETNAFLGTIVLQKPAQYPEHEIGWMLQADAEGKGIAFEAAVAARDWAWANCDWPSMVSYIDPENQRSIRLAERLGARHDPDAELPINDPCLVYRHPRPEATP